MTNAAGVQSIIASAQYANKYGNSVAAFADYFYKENLGATRLNQYLSYGSTYGQHVGGRGSAAFLAKLPATLQQVNSKILTQYLLLTAQNPGQPANETLTEAINKVKKTYTSRNVDIPVQYGKFFDRLIALVGQVDEIPAGFRAGEFLAKLSGSVTTERSFALTLAAIQGGLGDTVFGVTFSAVN